MTERIQKQDTESYEKDRLTGLPGMREFFEYTQRQIDENNLKNSVKGQYIVFFDIHNFKSYNIKKGFEHGDDVLQSMAQILERFFMGDLVARFSDDHFVVWTHKEHLMDAVTKVHDAFSLAYERDGMSIKAGIYHFYDRKTKVSTACDLAKLSCDSIRYVADEFFCCYNESIHRQKEANDYIIHEFDHAIQNGYIKAYYQPVVRTISGALCGLEALARWKDPERGMISPAGFIPALESSRLIYKLDLYMVREVCRQMRMCIDEGLETVPVSFNLSRIDFIVCPVFDEVEKVLEQYDIPRDMIRIEITESMLVKDAHFVQEELQKFKNAGYQVWMDDFGSGYSSLNLLKDYQYDEIKIDMEFLSSFTDKSKSILTSMVSMAKEIGMQTLAEGVETKEQFEFLKNIGCEKVQGYYFGKPMELQEAIANCKKQNMQVETRGWQRYYDEIGRTDFTTDRPFALYEYQEDTDKLQLMFMNYQYKDILAGSGAKTLAEVEENINASYSPLTKQFRAFQMRVTEDAFCEMDYSVRGRSMRVRARKIAACGNRMVYQTEVANLTAKNESIYQNQMEEVFRMMYLMFDGLYVADLEKDIVNRVMHNGLLDRRVQQEKVTVRQGLEMFEQESVYFADKKHYKEWTCLDDIIERISASGNGHISELFRTKELSGAYVWKVHRVIALPGTGNKKLLFAVMDTPLMKQDTMERVAYTMGIGGMIDTDSKMELWQSLVDSNLAYIFWKDTDRKFVGANRNFLNFYGIADLSEIVEKTDEDMQWHINNDPYRSDEWEVLRKGKTMMNRVGQCIVRGVSHTIMATKAPVYHEGKVTGLIGYFVDLDEYIPGGKDNLMELKKTDAVTGLMNPYGMLITLSEYVNQWEAKREPFALARITIRQHHRSVDTYGVDTMNKLLRSIGDVIRSEVQSTAVCGRIHSSNFNICMQYHKKEEVQLMLQRIHDKLSAIHELYGYTVTIRPEYKIQYVEDFESTPDLIDLLMKVEK